MTAIPGPLWDEPPSVEVGTTRKLPAIGRDLVSAALAARREAQTSHVTWDGQKIAVVAAPDRVAGPGELIIHFHDADNPAVACQCARPGTYARVAPNPLDGPASEGS